MFTNQQSPRIRDTFVQVRPLLLIQQRGLRFVQPVKSIWGCGVLRFVRMDQEGLFAVLDFYVFFGDAGLEVEDCVARDVVSLADDLRSRETDDLRIELERFSYPIDLCILKQSLAGCRVAAQDKRISHFGEFRRLPLKGIKCIKVVIRHCVVYRSALT